MDYAEKRKRVSRMIDGLYSEGIKPDLIIYKVSLAFGFGELFVKKRIELLERLVESNKKEDQKNGST